MEQGLAASVLNTYGTGEGQSTKHYYAGAGRKKMAKKCKKAKKVKK